MNATLDFPVSLPGSSAPLTRASVWRAVLTILALRLAGVDAAGQEEPPPLPPGIAELARKFAAVTEWQGIFEVAETGSSSGSNPNFEVNGTAQGEARSHGRFTLKDKPFGAWNPRRGMFAWVLAEGAPGEATGVAHEQFSLQEGYSAQSEEWRRSLAGRVPMLQTEFTIDLTRQVVSLHPGHSPEGLNPNWTRTGQRTSQVSSGDGQRRFATTSINETFPGDVGTWFLGVGEEDSRRKWAVVSGGPGVLNFTHEGKGNLGVFFQSFFRHSAESTKRSRVILFPVYDDLEVEVTIEGYARWRPEGSIEKPAEPGNHLVARATLKSKAGQVRELPEVKRFKFQLLDTSREPGVCLNWPLNAQDSDYDLRLAAEGGGEPAASGQKLEVASPPKDDHAQPYAAARIDSYDFGGRASLQVVCELEDGREIMGLMKGEGGEQDLVRLPKMKGPDWIAEVWRKEKRVEELAAGDDHEKVEGQKANGDGFTLYEEYRGWVVNGKHTEGDPLKKDFFVLNLIGADARAGIKLFEALSKLRVHSKLRRSEMSQTLRLMNGNHRDAPHRVDQHGVWMKTFTRAKLGDNGADTPMTRAGVAGRPGITEGIGILARGDTESIFNQPFNLPARDTLFAYDRAIAHELLHSVGVEHHGSGDFNQILGYVSPRNPHNKVGRPYYASSLDSPPTVVLDEAGHDLATKNYGDYVKLREFSDGALLARELEEGRQWIARNGVGYNGITSAQQYADRNIEILIIYCFMHLRGIVGAAHGEHSGDQDCVMRYYFAKFYEAAGRKDVLYVVTPGTERIGIDICHAGTGTGINAAGHRPQSRYGNASPGEGDCFSQICPNDAIPPRKVK